MRAHARIVGWQMVATFWQILRITIGSGRLMLGHREAAELQRWRHRKAETDIVDGAHQVLIAANVCERECIRRDEEWRFHTSLKNLIPFYSDSNGVY